MGADTEERARDTLMDFFSSDRREQPFTILGTIRAMVHMGPIDGSLRFPSQERKLTCGQ